MSLLKIQNNTKTLLPNNMFNPHQERKNKRELKRKTWVAENKR